MGGDISSFCAQMPAAIRNVAILYDFLAAFAGLAKNFTHFVQLERNWHCVLEYSLAGTSRHNRFTTCPRCKVDPSAEFRMLATDQSPKPPYGSILTERYGNVNCRIHFTWKAWLWAINLRRNDLWINFTTHTDRVIP